jgi:hypothetical protein
METPNINDFIEERVCEYRDRRYYARDNGAIMRIPKGACKPSKWDNVWTYGTKNPKTGYMILTGNVRVHQVVCTAFHGPAPEPNMVVDHIDTNRCNNRPENLRWVTRLENVILNPVTRKKIIYHCGSIEAFLANPSMMEDMDLTPDISWMKTVTKEEAAACKKHMEEWAEIVSKRRSARKPLGDFVYFDEEMREAAVWSDGRSYTGFYHERQERVDLKGYESHIVEGRNGLKDSLTPGAKQLNWKTPMEFPQIPQEITMTPLQDYLTRLPKGSVYCCSQYGDSLVYDAALAEDGSHLSVLTMISGVTNYALSEVTFQDGAFIHESIRTFFTEEGAQKFFIESRGLKWNGGDVMEDFC